MALTAQRACCLAASILLLCLPVVPAKAATPEDARRAYDAGRFVDAMGIWSELSRQGNAEAAFGIGLLYDLGNGTPENPEAAFFWYKVAAEAGMPAAEFNVAVMYDSGRGVTKSSANAALWYARASARGHHRAQFVLGQLYEQGDGVPRNPDAAASWFRDAASGGIAAAGIRLKALEATKRATQPNGLLVQAATVFPAKNLTVALPSADPTVELVWLAPAEPWPVRYEVQVRELGGPVLKSVFSATVSETAVLVRLPTTAAFYVWSVDAVGQDGSRASGEWSWFSVAPPGPSQQSMATMPDAPHPSR